MSAPLTDSDLDEIESAHTKLGEACEKCSHRFPYDECVSCGEAWPCSAIRLVAMVRMLQMKIDQVESVADFYEAALDE